MTILAAAVVQFEPIFNLQKERFINLISRHPKPEVVSFAKQCISTGYRIGFEGSINRKLNNNYPLTNEFSNIITKWLIEQPSIIGPFTLQQALQATKSDFLVTVPIFAIQQTKKVRPILDYSYPASGISINSQILDGYASVKYPYFIEIVRMIRNMGVGAHVWIVDAKDAYLRVPIDRRDWRYMAVHWHGLYFVICSLMFGLRSACKLYTNFADMIMWILIYYYKNLFKQDRNCDNMQSISVDHYLDDFFGGDLNPRISRLQFEALINLFKFLGIPTKYVKCLSPAQIIIILGFEYDTVKQWVRIPDEKLERILKIVEELLEFNSRQRITKRQLLSLIGKLRWLCMIIRVGRAFVRRLELVAHSLKHNCSRVRINRAMKLDLLWWKEAAKKANKGYGFEFILNPMHNTSVVVFTDASGIVGFGGFDNFGNYFQQKWKNYFKKLQFKLLIQFQELFAVVIAAKLWSKNWRYRNVAFYCDNDNVVWNIRKLRTGLYKESVMALIRILSQDALVNEYNFFLREISSKNNGVADDLSRFLKYNIPYENACQVDCMKQMLELIDEVFEQFEVHNNANSKMFNIH